MTGKIIKLYPGANTAKGFYSFYHHIIDGSLATKVYMIKGGPGTGKSTFMKRIAAEIVEAGIDIEMHYCSSDNNSLDGIVIPSLGVAMMDGTSPHVMDPMYPGAVDTILNFGEYWDEKQLRVHKEEIITESKNYQRCFRRAYDYLAAAAVYYRALNAYYDDFEAIDKDTLMRHTEDILAPYFVKQKKRAGKSRSRHMFASAITPKGCVNALGILSEQATHRIVLCEPVALGQSIFINELIHQTELYNLDYTAYHCSLNPEKIEHVYIPALDLIVFTSNSYHVYHAGSKDQVIPMNRFINTERLLSVASEQEELSASLNQSINNAVGFLSKAKAFHDQLETYYVANMNFAEIEELRRKVVAEIKSFK